MLYVLMLLGALVAENLLGKLEQSSVSQRFANFCFREQHGLVESYSAWDNCLDRPIIFKIFRRNIIEKRDRLARLENEVRNLATVISPHVVRILDFGKTKDVAYLAVDWVDGTPILECKEHCALEPYEVCMLISQAADGLAAAAEAGVLHRNIRASSILVTQEGFAKVTDFAVAMFVGHAEMPKVTRSGYFMGATENAAPELYAGERSGPLTETFSLGCVLYKALTGVEPYSDEVVAGFSVGELPQKPAYAPSSLVGTIDKELDEIVLSAIAIEPTKRLQSIASLREALKAWLAKQEDKRQLCEVTEKGEVKRIATATNQRLPKRRKRKKKEAKKSRSREKSKLHVPKESDDTLAESVAPPAVTQEVDPTQKYRTAFLVIFLVIASYIAGATKSATSTSENTIPTFTGGKNADSVANLPKDLLFHCEPYDCAPPTSTKKGLTILFRAIWQGKKKDVELLVRG